MRDEAGQAMAGAVLAAGDAIARDRARTALGLIRARQRRFFTGNYTGWAAMEEAFLTLEGAAMFVQFQHARRATPGQSWQGTLRILSERTDAWSQTEGLRLFLLIHRFDPKWPGRFLSNATPTSAVAYLEKVLESPL